MLSKTVACVMALTLIVGGALLSWPFHADHQFWAETSAMWAMYIVVGCVLGLYVAVTFIHALATMIYAEAGAASPPKNARNRR